MIRDFIKAWDANKNKLREYFQTHRTNDVGQYKDLVRLLFEHVVNPYLEEKDKHIYDLEKIHEIDDGKYQGTLLYVIPEAIYQPSSFEYVITYQGYGSCPVCDSLQELLSLANDDRFSDELVDDLMTLCLHLLQHCKIPYSYDED